MADYVVDSGSFALDAELSGTYTIQPVNHALSIGIDGQADTFFVLPHPSEWLLVEVYDVEHVFYDLGYTKWTDNLIDLASTLTTLQTIVDNDIEITNYKITATHYHGNDLADVYRGDDATPLALDASNIAFSPPITNWLLSRDLVSPINKILVCDEQYDCGVTWLC